MSFYSYWLFDLWVLSFFKFTCILRCCGYYFRSSTYWFLGSRDLLAMDGLPLAAGMIPLLFCMNFWKSFVFFIAFIFIWLNVSLYCAPYDIFLFAIWSRSLCDWLFCFYLFWIYFLNLLSHISSLKNHFIHHNPSIHSKIHSFFLFPTDNAHHSYLHNWTTWFCFLKQ